MKSSIVGVFLGAFISVTNSFSIQLRPGCVHTCKFLFAPSNQRSYPSFPLTTNVWGGNRFRTDGRSCICNISPKTPPESVPNEDRENGIVEISVEELASLLQAAGMPNSKTFDTAETKRLSSFLATPQAKTFMDAMAKQTLGGGGISGAMNAAAALPFLGKQDPGQPLRKSASQGDTAGIQSAIDADIWVRLLAHCASNPAPR